ncbi:MAG: DUF4097 family beta strand repeat protein [Clostridia bacterium]|nr:DUF4097 family beta strand repeat protein [Clostridia bacterium]
MKPASIIFLIVSLILVILGFVTTSVAMNLAPEDEKPVVEIQDKDVGYTAAPIGIKGVEKIELKLTDANVNIIGGAEIPRVELINFPEGLYSAPSPENKQTFTVTDLSDFNSVSGIAAIASNFKGLRSFVNYFKLAKYEKTVNIYLSADYPVNVISCNLESGNVRIENCVGSADYNITLVSGDVTVSNVDTTSSLTVNISTGNLNLEEGDITNLNAVIGTGSVALDANITKADVTIVTGNMICACPGSFDMVSGSLRTTDGKITIDGIPFGAQKSNLTVGEKSMDVTIEKGDIDITSGSAAIE